MIEKIMVFAGLMILPLLINPWATDPFERDKILLVRLLGVCVVCVTIFNIKIFNIKKNILKIVRETDLHDPGFWLTLFIGWATLATFFSEAPTRSIFGSELRGGGLLTIYASYALYWFFRLHAHITHTKKIIAFGSVVLLGIMSLLSFAQWFIGTHVYVDIPLITTGLPLGLFRPPATLGHPVYFGITIVLLLPFLWCAYKNVRSKNTRFLIFGIGIISVLSLYLTRTRIALIALGIMIVMHFIFQRVAMTKKQILFALVFVVGITLLFVAGSHTRESFFRMASLDVRMQEWRYAMPLILKKPIFGYGAETYLEYSLTRPLMQGEFDDGVSDRLHNIIFDAAWNFGIPGVSLLFLVFFLALRHCFKQLHQRYDQWHEAVFLSLISYLVMMLTSFDFSVTYVYAPFLLATVSWQT